MLTSRLAIEILERGKVSFYCSAWSNIGSVIKAIKSGICPCLGGNDGETQRNSR